MYKIVDWSKRKQEIGSIFRLAILSSPLPAEADAGFYEDLLDMMNITSVQDFAILYSTVEDAIMMARREKRPTGTLELFKGWLQKVRNG